MNTIKEYDLTYFENTCDYAFESQQFQRYNADKKSVLDVNYDE